jgi:hypothetical protein
VPRVIFSHLRFSASAYQGNYGQRFHADLRIRCKNNQHFRDAVRFKGSPHDLLKIVRFRNGPVSVKPLVSTSPILGAPRERSRHSAVASAAPAMRSRCRRRRFFATVRGQRKAATPCHQRKQRASPGRCVRLRPRAARRLPALAAENPPSGRFDVGCLLGSQFAPRPSRADSCQGDVGEGSAICWRPCTDDEVYGRLDRYPKTPVAVVCLAQRKEQSRDEFYHRVLSH